MESFVRIVVRVLKNRLLNQHRRIQNQNPIQGQHQDLYRHTEMRVNQIDRTKRLELVKLLKNFVVPIRARGDLEHAVITSGGVPVKEVAPRTMESKKAENLFFAGEVLDLDAYTGGYNLQIAFATAMAAAKGFAENFGLGDW